MGLTLGSVDGMRCFQLCATSGKVPRALFLPSNVRLDFPNAEIPFQHEAYSDGSIETETVGDTQVAHSD